MANQVKQSNELVNVESQSTELEAVQRSSGAIAEIQSALILARRFPRDEVRVFERLMQSAKRRSFAEASQYTFPRAGQDITGPSVDLAREAGRLWGNIRYGLNVIRDDEEMRGIEGWAWDLESNVKLTAQDEFRKLVYRKKDGWIKPDERDLRELTNRRGAILVRNCILQLLPADLIDEAVKECNKTLRGDVKQNKQDILRSLVKAFSGIDVTVADIETWAGGLALADLDEDRIVQLRAIYKSISDGNSKKSEHFKPAPRATESGSLSMNDLQPGKPEDHRGHDAANIAPGNGAAKPAAAASAPATAVPPRNDASLKASLNTLGRHGVDSIQVEGLFDKSLSEFTDDDILQLRQLSLDIDKGRKTVAEVFMAAQG